MCYEETQKLSTKMVMCERGSLRSTGGFRLSGRESVSSASLYKQRIDSMFDEERSVISQTYGTNQHHPRASSVGGNTIRSKAPSFSGRLDGPGGLSQAAANSTSGSIGPSRANSVQANIERMFSELALETDSSTPGVHSFSVDYLGSTPLPRRVTSLAGLQAPLARLYIAYRKTRPVSSNHGVPELAARLDISRAGLHVRHRGPRGDLEQLNPFPTIAVWSAVKFVLQPSEEDKNVIEYAFLPLITDPDNIDKQALFKSVEPADKKYILGRDGNAHSPLFTVVMRKIGVAKQLECHGFICQTSEDAIVIAATLYKALMAHMSKVPRARGGITGTSIASSNPPVRPPRRKRTPSSASADSDNRGSVRHDSSLNKPKSSKNKRAPDTPEPPVPPPPPPPPNKKNGIEQVKAKLATIKNADTLSESENHTPKAIYNESMEFLNSQHNKNPNSKHSSVRSKVSEKIELFSSLEKNKDIPRPSTLPPPVPVKPKREEPINDDIREIDSIQIDKRLISEPLRRSHSMRNSGEPGDILTKVAIPRSGSFLNASGLSRYKSTGQRNNGKKGGGSPLGFSELFNEFRVQEDLHSMDDILGAIIDSEGMSFNDLKPIYKEFLLKLAVTLTKDELFQHSKAIMKRQKKKLLRRNSSVQSKRKKMLVSARRLKLAFKKPFGKDILKGKILNLGDKKRSNSINPFELPKVGSNKTKLIVTSESSVSTSSYDLRHFHPKESTTPVPKRQSVRRRNSKRSDGANQSSRNSKRHFKNKTNERISTSEDSDFLTLSRKMGCHNRNSSSGYVSCSECESESCADRCYCAARARPRQPAPPPAERDKCCTRDDKCCEYSGVEYNRCYDASCCGCDTESCAESDKCYCHTGGNTCTNLAGNRSKRSPRRRSAPGPATLDSLYYEPFRSKSRSVIDHRASGLDYLHHRNSRFDTFERMSCATDVGRPTIGFGKNGRRSYSSDNLAVDYDIFMSQRTLAQTYNRKSSSRRSVGHYGSKEGLLKSTEGSKLFSDGRLLSAHRGLYRGPSAALADSLGYLP